jgi:hypothetical protein
VHARNKAVDTSINWFEVARAMAGFTGADCMGLMARAARMAARQGRELIVEEDIYAAMENKVSARGGVGAPAGGLHVAAVVVLGGRRHVPPRGTRRGGKLASVGGDGAEPARSAVHWGGEGPGAPPQCSRPAQLARQRPPHRRQRRRRHRAGHGVVSAAVQRAHGGRGRRAGPHPAAAAQGHRDVRGRRVAAWGGGPPAGLAAGVHAQRCAAPRCCRQGGRTRMCIPPHRSPSQATTAATQPRHHRSPPPPIPPQARRSSRT